MPLYARASKAGGSQQVLAGAQNKPLGLVVDGSHAYRLNTGDQTIVRVQLL